MKIKSNAIVLIIGFIVNGLIFFIVPTIQNIDYFKNSKNNISIEQNISKELQKKYYISCQNCTNLTKLYLNEAIEQVPTILFQNKDILKGKVSVILFNDPELYKTYTGTFPSYQFQAENIDDNIFFYTQEKSLLKKDFYGLIVHEITHSVQHIIYKKPFSLIIPVCFEEGQAEYTKDLALGLSAEYYLSNPNLDLESTELYSESIDYRNCKTFYSYITHKYGMERIIFLPTLLTDNTSFATTYQKELGKTYQNDLNELLQRVTITY